MPQLSWNEVRDRAIGLAGSNMTKKKHPKASHSLHPRLRVLRRSEIALGPGRVDLLEFIGKTGSLRAAAARMGMSYMRAWLLVKNTNRCFLKPVIAVTHGGRAGGGARLTATGERAVLRYRQMERECLAAMSKTWRGVRKLLKP